MPQPERRIIEPSLKHAKRAMNLPEFRALAVYRDAIDLARQGRQIYHLEVGQPGGSAPRGVIEAAHRFLELDPIGYTGSLGTHALRSAISNWYDTYYGLAIPAERIVVTMGSSGGFVLTYLTCFDPGEVIASPIPGYPCYRQVVEALGYKSLVIPTFPSDNFKLTPDAIHKAAKEHGPIHGLVLGNPANPTGCLLDKEELASLADVCGQWNIRMICDEVYHGLTYGKKATSMASDHRAVVLNSFSKYFCMTGWRIGWLVAPEELIAPMEKVAQNLFISASSLAQYAALHAFDCIDELEQKRSIYARNRAKLCTELSAIGFDKVIEPEGALYVYAHLKAGMPRAEAYCRSLLNAKGVAITPGDDFDPIDGHDWVRISFCASPEDIDAAMIAMWQFAKKND